MPFRTCNGTSLSRALVVAAVLSCPTILAAQSASTPDRPVTRAPSCPKALHRYDSVEDVPKPFDTLTAPPLNGSWNSREAMEAARIEGIAMTGATGYIFEEKREASAGAVRTMTRSVPVFVRADSARVHTECLASK